MVEDDPMFDKAVQRGMHIAGCSIDWVRTGPAAELAICNDVYAAVILGLGLLGKGGLEILKAIRERAAILGNCEF